MANTNIRRLKNQTQAAGTFRHFKTQTLTEQDLLLFINFYQEATTILPLLFPNYDFSLTYICVCTGVSSSGCPPVLHSTLFL